MVIRVELVETPLRLLQVLVHGHLLEAKKISMPFSYLVKVDWKFLDLRKELLKKPLKFMINNLL